MLDSRSGGNSGELVGAITKAVSNDSAPDNRPQAHRPQILQFVKKIVMSLNF